MPNGERPPSNEAGSVKSLRNEAFFDDGLCGILAYRTIGPTISASSMAGNFADCRGSLNDGNLESGSVSAKDCRVGSSPLA